MPIAYPPLLARPLCTLALLLIAGLTLPGGARGQCLPTAGRIEGTAFRDYDNDGILDDTLANPAPALRRHEGGAFGLTVNAYDSANTLVATTTTGANGSYALTGLTDGQPYRLEFVGEAAYLDPGPRGTDAGTVVQFGTAPACDLDVGLHNPARYCHADPFLSVPSYVIGNQVSDAFNTTPVLLAAPYSYGTTAAAIVGRGDDATDGLEWRDANGDNVADPTATEALANQIGTTYGIAWRRPATAGGTGTLFASAYFKQFAGFGPGGPGAIYQIPINPATGLPTGAPSVLVNVMTAFGMNVCINDPLDGDQDLHSTNPANGDLALAGTPNGTPVHSDLRYNNVGKCSFGDLEISEDESRLYTVNLFTRQVLAIDIASQTLVAGSPWNVPTAGLPNSAGTCAAGDVRPFALGIWDGLLYVGGVCSAESSTAGDTTLGTPALLHAYVWRVNTSTGAFTLVLNYQLQPDRVQWWPWTGWTPASTYDSSANFVQVPSPMLTDIEFYNGDLTLAFRDRLGDGWGYRIWDPADGKLEWASSRGDLKCASFSPGADLLDPTDDVFTKEGASLCGTRLADNGLVTGINVGGGDDDLGNGASSELYWGDGGDDEPPAQYQASGQTPFPIVPPTPRHEEAVFGGIAQIGVRDVVTTQTVSSAPYGYRVTHSGYFNWINNQTGYPIKAFNLNWRPSSAPIPDAGAFGKANGLGDIEPLCLPPPIEVGNRLWCDLDFDGVQDAGERDAGAGITVDLVCDTAGDGFGVGVDLTASTTTDANGDYVFNSSTPGLANGVPAGTACRVLVDPTVPALATECGSGPVASPANVISGATAQQQANSDQRDSDGVAFGADVGVQFTTGTAGRNDHTFDFGFRGSNTIQVTKLVNGAAASSAWVFTLYVTPATCDISGVTNPVTVPGGGGVAVFSGLPPSDGLGNNCVYSVAETPKPGYALDPDLSDPMSGITLLPADPVPDLWGIDELNSFLFSFEDYTQICTVPGAVSSGYLNLGVMQWNDAGVPRPIGDGIHAFTIDTNGIAYLAANDPLVPAVGPVIPAPVLLSLDLNNLTNPPVATVVGPIPLPGFDRANQDRLAGLAIQPGTGDLYALYDMLTGATNDHLLLLDKANGNVLADRGAMTGLGERVAEGTDLAFAQNGTLYVTDADDDNLYAVDLATAAITAVPDNGQGTGYGVPLANPNFVGLSWDWDNDRLIYANNAQNEFGEQTLMTGGNTFCTPFSNIVDDAESIGFLPVETPPASSPTLTVVNEQVTGSITVTKTVDGPPSPHEWAFTVSVLPVTCDLSGVTNPLRIPGNGGSASFTGLPVVDPAGADCVYSVSEAAQAGYFFDAAASDPLTGLSVGGAGVPRLWGVEEDDNELFSIEDYTQLCVSTAAAGYINYGTLRWNDGAGGPDSIGSNVEAFTIDTNGMAYMAKNASIGPTGSPALLRIDLNSFGNPPIVTVVGNMPILIDNGADLVSGLSIHPGTGDLYALWRNNNDSVIDELYIIDKSDASIVRFVGAISGLGQACDQCEDLEFRDDGTLYATDDDDDHLYQIDPNTGAILAVIDNNEAGGLPGIPKIEALGWDFDNNVLIFAEDNFDLMGQLTLDNGNNVGFCPVDIEPDGTPDLTDVEGMDFTPTYRSEDVARGVTNRKGVTLGDRVWLDVDGDGVEDIGEPGLAGVTVRLHNGVGGLLAVTTTDVHGYYLFDDRLPGTFDVRVDETTLPGTAGDLVLAPGSTNPSAQATLSAGQVRLDLDFGYVPRAGTAVIGDYVWSDADNDGIQDPGELGIGGVTLQLLDGTTLAVVATTTTGPGGVYLFSGVAAGEYKVRVTDTGNVLTGYTPTSGPQSIGAPLSGPLTVLADGIATDVDFGYRNPALQTISNRAWLDLDADGIHDLGNEPGIEGVTVNLLDDGGDLVATTASDAAGNYTFSGVPDGDWVIEITDTEDVLDNHTPTTAAATAGLLLLTVAGAPVSGVNFGYNIPGILGDRVWLDADGDGLQDPGEMGIGGVTVELRNAAGTVTLASTTTAADGSYTFMNLTPATYTIVVASGGVLTGLPQTGDPDSTLDNRGTATLAASQSRLDLDFGYQDPTPVQVAGSVFEDPDEDGVEEAGEPPLPGVTVELVHTASGLVVATTTTDANGDYVFPAVLNGSYTVVVRETQPALDGYHLTSGLDAIAVTVAGANVTGIDFGYNRDASTGVIGDYVWFDFNRDGVQNGGENGIGGVSLRLYEDTDGDGVRSGGDTLLATVITQADGLYAFSGLPPGNYFVDPIEGSLPAGFTATQGTGDASALIVLSDGEVFDRADFGYAPSVGLVIGDQIYIDTNGDGFPGPGEVGIPGVGVTVTGPGGYNQTTTTGPDGYYFVTGVTLSGIYTVTVNTATLPAGLDPVPTAYPSASQGFVVEEDDLLYADFGFEPTGPGIVGWIGDLVFLDADGDGAWDAGEPGIGDVTVTLETAAGVLLATTATDVNGSYDFTGVFPGNYRVRVTDTAGVLIGLNLSAGTNPTGVISLLAGQDYNNADFGYAPSAGTGTVGNFVWHDLNGDGDFDTEEDGVEGISVQLWLDVDNDGVLEPGSDNLIRTSWTDSNGEYYFHSAPLGDYLVKLTDKHAVLAGLSKTLGTPGLNNHSQAEPHDVTLDEGRAPSYFRADFGYFTTGTDYDISGIVFFDNDGDGLREPPIEVGIPNANLVLFRDLDGDGILDPSDPVFGKAVSGVAGAYSFTNLPNLSDWVIAVDTVGTFLDSATQTTQLATPDPGKERVAIDGADEPDHDFGFTKPPTQALVASFRALAAGDGVQLEWRTSSEIGTLGFRVLRWDAQSSNWNAVEEGLLPANPDAPRGSTYRLRDRNAYAGESHVYLLVETEVGGAERRHGPFIVEASESARERVSSFDVRPNGPSSFERERAVRAQEHAPTEAAGTVLASTAPGRALRLAVKNEGVHFVSASTIANLLGFSLGDVESRLASGDLRLTRGGKPIEWWVEDGSGLYFFGEVSTSPYSASSIYVLEPEAGPTAQLADGGSPAPAPGASFLATAVFEKNVFAATAAARDPDADFWYGSVLSAGTPGLDHSVQPFELDDVVTESAIAALTVRVFGATSSLAGTDHLLGLELNGEELATVGWDGLGTRSLSVTFPSSLLVPGANTLELSVDLPPGVSASVIYLDRFEITYPRAYRARGDRLRLRSDDNPVVTVTGLGSADVRVFDVTTPGQIEIVTGTTVDEADGGYQVSFVSADADREYYVSAAASITTAPASPIQDSDLLAPASGASYLVIAPESLVAAARRLADHRAGQGHLARVVSLQEVYDLFSHSQPDPAAVHDLLAHAWSSWPVRPEYVVLVGKGTYDYRDHKGVGDNLLPPLLVSTPNGLYASDTALGDVVPDRGAPEIAVGRIPVLNAAELDDYVDKLIAFEAAGVAPGDARVMMLADNSDDAGSFAADSDAVAAGLPASLSLHPVYLDELSLGEARQQLFEALGEGVRLVSYLGHGGLDRFAAEGLLTVGDVPGLVNGGRLPVVASFTCAVGRFEVPGATSLGEALVLGQDRGAIAVVAPSGLSFNDAASLLNENFAAALFDGHTVTVGQAFRDALRRYQNTGAFDHLLRIYNLLGDPALPLPPLPVIDDGGALFSDGFESGDLSAWSATSP